MELKLMAILGRGRVGIYAKYIVTFLAVGEDKRLFLCHLLKSDDPRPMRYLAIELTDELMEIYRDGLTVAEVFLIAKEYWEVQVDQCKPITACVSDKQNEIRHRIGAAIARSNQ